MSVARNPIPADQIEHASPYGIDGILRVWGDTLSEDQAEKIISRHVAQMREIYADDIAAGRTLTQVGLALSGGGADGAFGAGLLAGWTARGDRPEFDIVTGVSTGAVIGLFAFLGADYDETLRKFYTEYETSQLLEPAPFSALRGALSLTDTTGYNTLIDEFIDEEIVEKLAAGARQGRRMLIGTTNLDAARPVVWDITRIANSGHPEARALIQDIVRASSAIPAVFPPVVIPIVGTDGKTYDELHVDGGATQQVMLFSPELPLRRLDEATGVDVDRTLYVIINNSLTKPYEPVELGVLSIAGRAASSLISGSGGGDLYKIYAITQRDDVDFRVVWIPQDFTEKPTEAFDPPYMRSLYLFGYQYGVSGREWQDAPPNFDPK